MLTRLDTEFASLVKSGALPAPHWVGFSAPFRFEMPLIVTVQESVPGAMSKSVTAIVPGAESPIVGTQQPTPLMTPEAFFSASPGGNKS